MRWFKRRQKYEKIDPMSFWPRAEAVRLQVERVHARCERAAEDLDLDAMRAARAETDLLLDNLREIRLEQIEAASQGYRKPIA